MHKIPQAAVMGDKRPVKTLLDWHLCEVPAQDGFVQKRFGTNLQCRGSSERELKGNIEPGAELITQIIGFSYFLSVKLEI